MIKLYVLFCLFVFVQPFTALHAQTQYEKDAIYLKFATYIKNDTAFEIGLTGGKLMKEMKTSPDAVVEMSKFQRKRSWMLVLSALQLGTSIAAITTHDKHLRTGLLIGSGALSIIALPLYIGSQDNISKAVWLRNRDFLKSGK